MRIFDCAFGEIGEQAGMPRQVRGARDELAANGLSGHDRDTLLMNLRVFPCKRRVFETIIEPLEKRIAPAFTVTLSGSVATFIGDGANDTLVIGENGGNLTHNRFAAGDPGYADQLDFNTSLAGSQRFTSRDTDIVNVTGGAGIDDVTITVPMRLTVGSINVGGTVTLTGIVAEQLGAVKIGGAKLPLSKTAVDNFPVGSSGTFRVREV